MRTRLPFLAALAVTLCIALCATANAATGTSTTTWTNPTTYVDGSPLVPANLVGYDILCKFTPTGSSTPTACVGLTPASISTGPQTSVSTTMTYPAQGGVACYQVVAKTAQASSDPSPVTPSACKTFDALKPSSPTGVTVTVTVSVNITGLPAGTTVVAR